MNDLIDLPGKGPLTIRLSVSSDRRGARGVVHVPCDVGAIHDGRVRATPLLGRGTRDRHPARHRRGRVAGAVSADHAPNLLPIRNAARVRQAVCEQSAELTGTVTLRRGGAIVATIPAVMSARATAPSSIDAGADLPLGELRPGAYVMTFTATVSAGASVTRAVPFTVR